MTTIKPSGVVENVFNQISQLFNKKSMTFENKSISRDSNNKLMDMNEELGRFHYVMRQKQLVLVHSLYAPVGVMIGGNLMNIKGGGAEEDKRYKNLSFVATDRPSGKIYSTSRIIANILKKYEKELSEVLDDGVGKEIEDLLVSTYNIEKELFQKIFKMDELQYLLDGGEIDDIGVGNLETLVIEARRLNRLAEDKREKTIKKITDSTNKIMIVPSF